VIGRVSQLNLLAAVCLAGPERAVQNADVSDRLAVVREGNVLNRKASKEWNELFCRGIVVHELGALIIASDNQFLAVGRDSGKAELQGAEGQLNRRGCRFAKQTGRVRQDEDVAKTVAAKPALKKEIAAIGRPDTAALMRRRMPAGQ